MLLTVIVFVIIQGTIGSKSREHYCTISSEHTMCLYQRFNSMGQRCRHYFELPTSGVKRMILKKHNSLRNNYASNSKQEFKVPNMLGLEWDEELTEIASRWAMQCPYYEDDFRDVERFKVANMVKIISHPSSYRNLLELWISVTNSNVTFHRISANPHPRLHNYLESTFRMDEPLSLITNPYFKYVGCAAAVFRQFEIEDEIYRTILVCNYGPLNVSYDKYHQGGYPCTQCPNDTYCNQKSSYPSLCFGRSTELGGREIKPRANWYDEVENLSEEEDSSEIMEKDESRTGNNGSFPDNRRSKNLTDKYCKLTCDNGGNHTMCKYQKKTDEWEEAVPLLSMKSKQYILFMHNDIRNNFAGNRPVQHPGYNLPLAANMREMVWNDELEKIASRWSMQCKKGHDECRDILMKDQNQPMYVSQLHHALYRTDKEMFPSSLQGFQKWMRGMSLMTPDMIDPFARSNQEGANHYDSFAQLIWAETYMLGCAMTLCRSSNVNKSLIVTVCNYAPGGMIPGKSIYEVGGPCSRCTKLYSTGTPGGDFCSEEFPNLCSEAVADFPDLAIVYFSLLLLCFFNKNLA